MKIPINPFFNREDFSDELKPDVLISLLNQLLEIYTNIENEGYKHE